MIAPTIQVFHAASALPVVVSTQGLMNSQIPTSAMIKSCHRPHGRMATRLLPPAVSSATVTTSAPTPDRMIRDMVEDSYDLVVDNLPARDRP